MKRNFYIAWVLQENSHTSAERTMHGGPLVFDVCETSGPICGWNKKEIIKQITKLMEEEKEAIENLGWHNRKYEYRIKAGEFKDIMKEFPDVAFHHYEALRSHETRFCLDLKLEEWLSLA